ncbi:hypothetical protein DYB32_009353 [Aphanomyces invadans]|uniref:E2F/DP family winged-helix DNA-binding domain-containing protein n=1 Tax=Aphanomyces invadans TaxID=157072 RepID=A0A3R6YXV3_9STRA|nr:hypothetical protein DYB32_009353 [Aphanomyces invadans]
MAPARGRKRDEAEGFVSNATTGVPRKAAASVAKNLFVPSDASDATHGAASAVVIPRVTKRELKKQVEEVAEDVDQHDDGNGNDDGGDNDDKQRDENESNAVAFQSPPVKQEVEPAFGSQSATPVTPGSLHDDFINLMKAQGLERMATDAGLLKDGQFRDLKREWGGGASSGFQGGSASTPKKKKPRAPVMSTTPLSDKGSKGLRHFSMKVCQKVEEKHVTTYNEVADELVHEFVTMRPAESVNIRRRVYDALNVLMAMDIISKEKKEIRWRGLPSNAKQDLELLQLKKQQLQELLLQVTPWYCIRSAPDDSARRRKWQQIALKNLIRRNKQEDKPPALSRIALPFILVNTSKDTVIQCEMSEDRQDIFFNFSGPFEINDDSEILKRMSLHHVSAAEAATHIPEKLVKYLPPEYLAQK